MPLLLLLLPLPTGCALHAVCMARCGGRFQEGDIVQVHWRRQRGAPQWHDAVVDRLAENGTFDVTYRVQHERHETDKKRYV